MRSRWVLVAGVVLVAVLAAGGGWLVGRNIESPEEAAASAAAPPASLIAVPVESRALSNNVVVRGDIRFSDSTQLAASGGGNADVEPIVTGAVPEVGDELVEGDVAIEVGGRPLFILEGQLPVFRSLGPGSNGDDVLQLEQSLDRLGFSPGPVDGVYDLQTEDAVELFYGSHGYDAVGPSEAEREQLTAARQQVTSARSQLTSAQRQLTESTTTVPESQRLALQQGVIEAQRTLDAARTEATAANTPVSVEYDAAAGAATAAREAATAAQTRLDQARAGTNPDTGTAPTPEELAIFEADVVAANAAEAAAEADLVDATTNRDAVFRTSGEAISDAELNLAIAIASRNEALSPQSTSGAQEQVTEANAAVVQAEADLADLEARVGIRVPQAEIVFLPLLPRRVDRVLVERGDRASGNVLEISGADLLIDSAVSAADRPLVSEGDRVQISDEGLGIALEGVIIELADQPGTDGASESRYAMKIEPDGGDPAELRGLNVRIVIPVEGTAGEVIAVPLAALSAGADGTARVQVERSPGVTDFVEVEVGLSAAGFAEVTPLSGNLAIGDQVIVGREGGTSPAFDSGDAAEEDDG